MMTDITLVEMEKAAALRKKRQWAKAAAIYQAILSRQPETLDAGYYLAVCAYETGHFQEGLEAIGQVVLAKPKDAIVAYTHGLLLAASGQKEPAAAEYRRALSLKPDFPQALVNLAAVEEQHGHYREAISYLVKALSLVPGDPMVMTNLGSAQMRAGRYHEALDNFLAALKAAPGFFQALLGSAEALAELQRIEEAILAYRQLLAGGESRPDSLNRFVRLLLGQELLDEALQIARKSVAAKKANPESLVLLGKVLERQGKLREARERFQEAARIDPAFQGELTRFLICQGQTEDALSPYRDAAGKHSDDAEAFLQLGATATDAGLYDEALQAYGRAVELAPNNALAHTFLAYRLLASGDFQAGWEEFEWRLQTPAGRLPQTGLPRFTLDMPSASRVLVQAEQGYGDVLQFCRYVFLLRDKGFRPTLWLQPELERLFAGIEGVETYPLSVTAAPLKVSDFDAVIPVMSLPRAFGHVLPAQFPLGQGYLRAEPWADLAAEASFKVGIAWAGRASHPQDWARSMPGQFLKSLMGVPGVSFYSLQKPARPNHIQQLPITDLAPRLGDFADTASAIASMDLVLTIDTAIAHLAGALGKTVWMLLPHRPEWRWHFASDTSPWYASMRIWRQSSLGDWESLLRNVRQKLETLAP